MIIEFIKKAHWPVVGWCFSTNEMKAAARELVDDAVGPLIVELPRFGKAQPPRRAGEKSRAQIFFEFVDLTRHR